MDQREGSEGQPERSEGQLDRFEGKPEGCVALPRGSEHQLRGPARVDEHIDGHTGRC